MKFLVIHIMAVPSRLITMPGRVNELSSAVTADANRIGSNYQPMIKIARPSDILCYLDFDGVLHDDEVYFHPQRGVYLDMPGRILFEWADILDSLFAPYPEVKIILSTSWVRMKSFHFAKRHLPRGLQDRVIGATYHHREMIDSAFDQTSRGQQVWSDVLRRGSLRWFAIDNDDSGWPRQCRNELILTDDRTGLSEPAVQQQIRDRLAALSDWRL